MSHSADFQTKKLPLSSGTEHMAALGFGTLIADPIVTMSATRDDLPAGFRHLDCAERYRNEGEVGMALGAELSAGTVDREDVFVTTKLWNTNHRPDRVEGALKSSLVRLEVDYADLYLMHTPFAFEPGDEQNPRDANGDIMYDDGVTLLDTWNAMESVVDRGCSRAIGLSDISLDQLSPLFQSELQQFCTDNEIVLLAFAPLGHGIKPGRLDDPVVMEIAARLGRMAAEVLLAWAVQRGTALLTTPKSAARASENFDVRTVPQDAFDAIDQIATRQRFKSVVTSGSPGFIPPDR
jgi:alcohol dehydrogenase (NADP+)